MYLIQRVQGLSPADYPPRENFCRWFLAQAANPLFVSSVLFTDEATFGRDGITNFHNEHIWGDRDPRAVVQIRHKQQFRINVCTGIVGDCLVGPYVLPACITGAVFRDFIQNTLPDLLHEDVPLQIRQNMWFMHDGAPAHFSLIVPDTLAGIYHDRWIGRGGPVPWPARSPDLNPLDFYLWGHLKYWFMEQTSRLKKLFIDASWKPAKPFDTIPEYLKGCDSPCMSRNKRRTFRAFVMSRGQISMT